MTRPAQLRSTSNEEMAQLLRQAQRHDVQAFDRLYELYVDRIYRYVWYRVRDADLAEDLTVDIFVQVIQSIHTFRISAKDTVAICTGWMFRIAHNYLSRFFCQQGRSLVGMLPDAAHPEVMDLVTLVQRYEREEALHAAIAKLSDDQRQVLVLRFWEQLSHAETAKAMGRSEGAVKVLQHRALAALRRILAPFESGAPE